MNTPLNWTTLINENSYICEKNKGKKDEHSFCYLIDTPMTQSQNIIVGNCMEKLLNDAIQKYTKWKNLNENKTKKGEHQTDHLWINEETRKIIYYQYETKYPHAGAGKRIQF